MNVFETLSSQSVAEIVIVSGVLSVTSGALNVKIPFEIDPAVELNVKF